MTKPWWQSKTLWVNFLAVVALIADALLGGELLAENGEVAVGGMAALNGALRFVTRATLR